jgi:hypothetical protein
MRLLEKRKPSKFDQINFTKRGMKIPRFYLQTSKLLVDFLKWEFEL